MSASQRLDGLWGFRPLTGDEAARLQAGPQAPRFEPHPTPIRVPGYWNSLPPEVGGDWGAYEHYRYPPEWTRAEAGLYKRRFRAEGTRFARGGRTRLHFDAVAGHTIVWLNGQRLGENFDSFLPFAFDVTGLVREGEDNELIVLVQPPPRRGALWLQPCGSWVGWHLRGIWQSVRLESTPTLAVADVFVQPSVRQQLLRVEVTLERPSVPVSGQVRVRVSEARRLGPEEYRGRRGGGTRAAPVFLDLGVRAVRASPEEETTLVFEAPWPAGYLWTPENPRLCDLEVVAEETEDRAVHRRTVRFGFREFWIEGTGFRLNGEPIRLFGDAWHYMGVVQQNPAYARTWFRLARQLGANAIRTHAMPYPPFYFDLADELGLLIVDESAVYGSAGTLAYDEPVFWERCREHIRRLVRRDRNHPSVVVWSAVNETVWKGGAKIFPELLRLADEARRLDPTRPVTFDENDCDLGGAAAVHAGHYGTPEHWEAVWRRDRPLIVHEFSALYHGGPAEACPYGDDAVYADFDARLRATGMAAAEMFLRLRRLGAASITPWNIVWYCLEPLPGEAIEPISERVTRGGAAFDRIGPHSLTLNYGFLPQTRRWHPNPAFGPLARCYRRRQVFVRVRPRQGFAGHTITIRPYVFNDAGEVLEARLVVQLRATSHGPSALATAEVELRVDPHQGVEQVVDFQLPAVSKKRTCRLTVQLVDVNRDATLASDEWRFHLHPPLKPRVSVRGAASIWAPGGQGASVCPQRGLRVLRTEAELDGFLRDGGKVLFLAAAPPPFDRLREWLRREDVDRWLRAGGRLVVLPDSVAGDPDTAVAFHRQPSTHAYPRASTRGASSTVLRGLTADHFRDWGSDGVVARLLYERPTTGPALTLLDVGDAAAGLEYAALLAAGHGAGEVVWVAIDLLNYAAEVPAAAILLSRLADRRQALLPGCRSAAACLGSPAYVGSALFEEVGLLCDPCGPVCLCDGTSADAPAQARAWCQQVGTPDRALLIECITPQTVAIWSALLGVPLVVEEDLRFNIARVPAVDWPGMDGVNNYDLCWVQRNEQQPIVRHTLPLDTLPAGATVLVQTVATRWEDYEPAHEQHKVGWMRRRMRDFDKPRAALVRFETALGTVFVSQLRLHEARGPFRARARRILSRWLDGLGVARDPRVSPLRADRRGPTTAEGYIRDWLVLGPFSPAGGHPLDAPCVVEAEIRPADGQPAGDRVWRRVSSPLPCLDFGALWPDLPPRDRVAYVAIYVYSPTDRSVLLDRPDLVGLRVGADGGTKVWLNGELLGRFDFVRPLVLDQDRMDAVPLRRGWNILVVKLHNPAGAWRVAARFVTSAGGPVHDLAYATTPPAENDGQ